MECSSHFLPTGCGALDKNGRFSLVVAVPFCKVATNPKFGTTEPLLLGEIQSQVPTSLSHCRQPSNTQAGFLCARLQGAWLGMCVLSHSH